MIKTVNDDTFEMKLGCCLTWNQTVIKENYEIEKFLFIKFLNYEFNYSSL